MWYNRIKNIMLGVLSAVIYAGYVVEPTPVLTRVMGIVAVFATVTLGMCDVDQFYLKRKRVHKVGKPKCTHQKIQLNYIEK